MMLFGVVYFSVKFARFVSKLNNSVRFEQTKTLETALDNDFTLSGSFDAFESFKKNQNDCVSIRVLLRNETI